MPKSCFIIGPIGSAGSGTRKIADWLMRGLIKPVLEADGLDYVVKRADEDASPGSINHAVMTDVINADLVIADLTGFNPNVFYELGIRHAVQRSAIHIIAEAVDLPFDNKDQRTIFVDLGDFDSLERAKARLKEAVEATHIPGYQVVNPYTQAGALNELRGSLDPKDQLIAGLEERLSILEERQGARVAKSFRRVERTPDQQIALDTLRKWGTAKRLNAAYWQGLSGERQIALIVDILDRPYGDLTDEEATLFETALRDGVLPAAISERARNALEDYYIDKASP